MANFDSTTQTKRDSIYRAAGLLDRVRAVYGAAKGVQSEMALYQAGTDPTFNAAINALFSPAERQELGQMLSQINNLVQDWEANHVGAIQG